MWMEDDRKVNRYCAVINWNEGRGSGEGGWTRVCVKEMRVGEGGELAFILLFPFLVSIFTCYYFFKNSLRAFFLYLFFYISVSISSSLSLSVPFSLAILSIYVIYLSFSLSHACLLTSQLFPISLFFCPILSHCLLSFPLGITLFLCYEC